LRDAPTWIERWFSIENLAYSADARLTHFGVESSEQCAGGFPVSRIGSQPGIKERANQTYWAVIYAFVWLTRFGGFYNSHFVERVFESFGLGPMRHWVSIVLYFLFTATITLVRDCATVLGEEIGWRGFLVPELAKRHSFAATAIISGFIWAFWHYPIFLLADGYNGGTPVWYYLPLFTVLLPTISFVWTWMRLKSDSLWPGDVLHAAHNTFIQEFFDPLTVDNSKTRYVAGEFGVALLVVSILMAIYFWSRRDEVRLATRAVTFPN